MPQPTAKPTEEREAGKAAAQAFFDGDHHVGVVLLGRVAHHVAAGRYAAERVEIAEDEIGLDAERIKVFQPAVGGDHEVTGGRRESRGVKIPSAHDPADAHHEAASLTGVSGASTAGSGEMSSEAGGVGRNLLMSVLP